MIGWLVVFYVPSTARSLISVLSSQYYEFISFTKFKVILEKLKTFLGHAIHNGMSPLSFGPGTKLMTITLALHT